MLRRLAPSALALFSLACGAGGAITPAQSPEARAEPSQAGPEPAHDGPKLAGLGEPPPGILPVPAECEAYTGAAPKDCAAGSFEERLALALAAKDAARDLSLRCLEGAPEAPPGWVRSLRADLAPRACGDVVVGPEAAQPGAARELADTLVALGVGARLRRSVEDPPLPKPPFDKPQFLKHFKEVLSPWIVAQARAVDGLSQVGVRLGGYARGVVAIEAGLADLRFVELARQIDLPEEMKKDPEIRETYLVALEQALEPRVARGRDAALVGLGEFSKQGITSDRRLVQVRSKLSELYAGRRLDALDQLLLPPLPPADESTPALRVAARLPAFYALKLAASPTLDDPKLLRARLEQGVPPALWLGALPQNASPELSALAQRGLFQLGQVYFWAEPFARAATIPTAEQDSAAALVGALSKVLARGPRNAAAMMLGAPTLPAELRDVSALDALAKAKSPVAGFAELDAAYLRGLAPPANDPTFWKEQTARYRRAEKKLDAKPDKAKAGELAKAAADTEQELRKQAKP
jgi:hypothetical protein